MAQKYERTSRLRGGYPKSFYKTPIYRTWFNMKTRCLNKTNGAFQDYGERGVTVSSRWLDFKNFLIDMGPSYVDGLTLDRIDNSGNYEKDNCRWATRKIQANNRRSNRFLHFRGMNKTVAEWAAISEVKPSTFRQRLYTYKWPLKDCFRRCSIG